MIISFYLFIFTIEKVLLEGKVHFQTWKQTSAREAWLKKA